MNVRVGTGSVLAGAAAVAGGVRAGCGRADGRVRCGGATGAAAGDAAPGRAAAGGATRAGPAGGVGGATRGAVGDGGRLAAMRAAELLRDEPSRPPATTSGERDDDPGLPAGAGALADGAAPRSTVSLFGSNASTRFHSSIALARRPPPQLRAAADR